MKLTQIDILKYKSIKQPVSIYFNDGQVVTLIGKNGSGKTNVLEALNYIFEANSHWNFYTRDNIDLQYRVHIKLSEKDITSVLPEAHYDKDNCELIACNTGEGFKIDTIESDYLVPLLKQEIEDIRDLAHRLEKALIEYEKTVESIVIDDDRGNISLMGFSLQKDHSTNFYMLKHSIDYNVDQALKTVEKLLQHFKEDNNALQYIANGYINFYGIDNLEFQLKYDEPILSPFEQKYININKKAIKAAITRINKKTLDCCKNITELSRQLVERTKVIGEALDADEIMQRTKAEQYCSFLKKVQSCVGRKCLFLRNDNSELLFGTQDMQRQYQRRSNSNYILETYLRQIYSGDNKEDLLKAISEGKGVELTHAAIDDFENYLNKSIPKFDRGMFSKIKIDYSKENGLQIKLQEKDELIDLNSTSAGRRWYFTYYFMKNILQNGDVFIIDEPAGMLHPSAQQEVLAELKLLAANGIKVIYSTHSPYMIPSEYGNIHHVTMSSDIGTEIYNLTSPDKLSQIIQDELGVSKIVDILFNLEKTIILVEGVADKICLEKFTELLNMDLNDYYIHVCDGEAILQVAYMCLNYQMIKVKVVLDNDNKCKTDGYQRGHSMYADCLKIIDDNPDNCVYIGEGEHGCLEDMFVENPNTKFKKYVSYNGKWKIDINAVKSLKSIDDVSEETKRNFEQLFIKLGIPKLDI